MARLVTFGLLFLAFAWGIIGLSAGINALIKEMDMKDFVQDNAPQGVDVNIDTSEASDPGAVVSVGCGLLSLTSFLTCVAYVTNFKPVSRRPVLFAAFVFWFWAIWIFASLVAYDVIAVNRDAKVTAFLGDTQLPDSVILQQEAALGVSRAFWDHDFSQLLAILPWFAFLFSAIVGFERFIASKSFEPYSGARTAAVDAAAAERGPTEVRVDDAKDDTGKPSVEHKESVKRQ